MSLNKADQAAHARQYKAYAAAKPVNATPSRTLTNATTSGPYLGSGMASSRSNADDHLKLASLGLGAQIVRSVEVCHGV